MREQVKGKDDPPGVGHPAGDARPQPQPDSLPRFRVQPAAQLGTVDREKLKGPEEDLLTNVTIPSSVTNIGIGPFVRCWSLTGITVDPLNPVYTSLDGVLFNKDRTTLLQWPGGKAGAYTIPEGVISVADWAFEGCPRLNSITFPNSVTSLGTYAFSNCRPLTEMYFYGNAPTLLPYALSGILATLYYLPGTTGWDATFGGRPTALWRLPYPMILTTPPDFGVQSSQFGFRISWATNASLLVEASGLIGSWIPVNTNLLTNGWSYFKDAQWTNYPARLYRVRSR